MIIISEVTHTGEVHYQVNSCFVEMIASLDASKRILFYAETKHNDAVRANLKKKNLKNVEFIPFHGYYDEKKFTWISKIIGECIHIIKVLRKGKKLKNDLYVWTCLFPTGHLFLNLLALFQINTQHIIILHGELEFLKIHKKRNSEVLLGYILKAGIYLSSKKTRYIVLGDNIKKSLKSLINRRIIKRTFSILHPYDFSVDQSLSNENIDDLPIKIGAIGTQMLSKNSNYIYTLSQYFTGDIIQNRIKFLTIGKVLPELTHLQTKFVESIYSDSFVSQKNFELEISNLNFVIFFYDNNAYQLCASGAIFEAIRLGIPVISIKNDFFQSIFDNYGEMGFLCNSLDEIKILIDELKANGHIEKIKKIKENIAQFKINNDLANLTQHLKSII